MKFLSLVVAICIAQIYWLGAYTPSDPLFLFMSNDPLATIGRLCLAFAVLGLAFKKTLRHRLSRVLTGVIGAGLGLIGAAGLVSPAVIDALSNYIGIIDFVLLAEVGVIFGLAAVAYKPEQTKTVSRRIIIHQPRSSSSTISFSPT